MTAGAFNTLKLFIWFDSHKTVTKMSSFDIGAISNSTYLCAGTVLLISLYLLFRRDPRIKSKLDKIDGPPMDLPILGGLLYLLRPDREYMPMFDKWVADYGPSLKIWMGPWFPYVAVTDAVTAEKVMSTTNHINKGKYAYDKLRPWLAEGLLTASKNKWSVRRKLLTPSFHFKILDDFIPVFNEQASILIDCLKKESGTEKTFDIYPYIAKCTLDVICETAMGKKVNAQTSETNKIYIDAVNGITEVIMTKIAKPWIELPVISYITGIAAREKEYLKILHGFTDSVIQARKADFKKESEVNEDSSSSYYGKKRKAFLDLLLEYSDNGRVLSDADIREEVDTFMFEGHDTTGANLAWTVLLFAMNPKHQKLVQEELDSVFADDPERDVTIADISQMKYLDGCVKESLRLFPSVPFIVRETDSDIVLDDGRVIPEGVSILVSIYHIHRNEKYYSDPMSFRPERFLELDDGNGKSRRHPFAYVPFSAGPRNCIGQKFALLEEKIILAKLLRHYTFETNVDMKSVIMIPDLILRSEDGINVKLNHRKN